MAKVSMNSVLFNIAGVGMLVTAVGYMGYSFLVTPKVPQCTARYPAPTQFDFSGETGKPLTSIELQARAGVQAWGIGQNAKIVGGNGSSPPRAMEVSLATTGNEDSPDQNGIGFVWPLSDLKKAASTCLSYQVFIPETFKFTEPGYLPGMFGVGDPDADQSEGQKPDLGFKVRMGWAAKGDIGIEVTGSDGNGTWITSESTSQWPAGRWVSVEQEVVLNTPGADDAVFRVWLDGTLVIDYGGFNLRQTDKKGLSGVVSEIGYARTASDAATIAISPFRVSWQ